MSTTDFTTIESVADLAIVIGLPVTAAYLS